MTEEPGGLQPMSHQQSDTTEGLSAYSHTHMYFSCVCTHIQYIHTHIFYVCTHIYITHIHIHAYFHLFSFLLLQKDSYVSGYLGNSFEHLL